MSQSGNQAMSQIVATWGRKHQTQRHGVVAPGSAQPAMNPNRSNTPVRRVRLAAEQVSGPRTPSSYSISVLHSGPARSAHPMRFEVTATESRLRRQLGRGSQKLRVAPLPQGPPDNPAASGSDAKPRDNSDSRCNPNVILEQAPS
jgi:hypothetical protein